MYAFLNCFASHKTKHVTLVEKFSNEFTKNIIQNNVDIQKDIFKSKTLATVKNRSKNTKNISIIETQFKVLNKLVSLSYMELEKDKYISNLLFIPGIFEIDEKSKMLFTFKNDYEAKLDETPQLAIYVYLKLMQFNIFIYKYNILMDTILENIAYYLSNLLLPRQANSKEVKYIINLSKQIDNTQKILILLAQGSFRILNPHLFINDLLNTTQRLHQI